jgi:hypothetical protein
VATATGSYGRAPSLGSASSLEGLLLLDILREFAESLNLIRER